MKTFWLSLLTLVLVLITGINTFWSQTKDKVLFNEGVENYRKGQYQTAQQNFESVAQQNPQNTRALFNAGNASFLNGDFEKAKTYFGNYVQTASAPADKARGYYNMGNVHLQEAMAAEGNPQTSSQAQSNYKNAINAYKQSLKYNPNDADAKYNLTYAMNKLQQNQKNENKDKNNQQENKENQENKDEQQNQENKEKQENKNNQNNEGKQEEKKDDQKGNQNKPNDQKGGDKENEKNGSEGDKKDQKQNEKDAQAAKAQAIKDLDAINNDEKKILQKVSGSKATKSSESTLEKDW